jgi:hypothetical protein
MDVRLLTRLMMKVCCGQLQLVMTCRRASVAVRARRSFDTATLLHPIRMQREANTAGASVECAGALGRLVCSLRAAHFSRICDTALKRKGGAVNTVSRFLPDRHACHSKRNIRVLDSNVATLLASNICSLSLARSLARSLSLAVTLLASFSS